MLGFRWHFCGINLEVFVSFEHLINFSYMLITKFQNYITSRWLSFLLISTKKKLSIQNDFKVTLFSMVKKMQREKSVKARRWGNKRKVCQRHVKCRKNIAKTKHEGKYSQHKTSSRADFHYFYVLFLSFFYFVCSPSTCSIVALQHNFFRLSIAFHS